MLACSHSAPQTSTKDLVFAGMFTVLSGLATEAWSDAGMFTQCFLDWQRRLGLLLACSQCKPHLHTSDVMCWMCTVHSISVNSVGTATQQASETLLHQRSLDIPGQL